ATRATTASSERCASSRAVVCGRSVRRPRSEITPPSPRLLMALARVHLRLEQDRGRRGGDAPALLERDRHFCRGSHRLGQEDVLAAGAAAEESGGLDTLPGDYPRLVGLVRRG